MQKSPRYSSRTRFQDIQGEVKTFKIIPITPIPKPRMVNSDRWKKRPVVEKYWKYKDALNLMAPKNINWEHLSIKFVMPIPGSWSKKKSLEMVGKPHQQTPDLDNLIKALKDCLLKQDCAVWHYEDIKKVWGVEGCIVVKICPK